MLGQYEPTSGAVLLQDKAIDSYDKNGLYKHISVLVQNFSLFSFMTVRENMQAVNPRKLSENEIDDALELAGIKTLVHDLPKGLDTRMDRTYDDGTEFSGGQQQRLAIARSFAKKASLLILDEPTSAIDAKAEKKIFETIFERHAKATVIIVSHRFSTVKKADRIIVLHGGKILEQGTHKELMETQGHYAELYNLQAQEYKD
jgi:ABC-type multidrug transport system fused ATPase/permease subunit